MKKREQSKNLAQMLILAFCFVVCFATTAAIADDFGIESATPIKIADPINPQPGMVCKFYDLRRDDIQKCLKDRRQLEAFPILVSRVDKGNEFACGFTDKEIARNVMSWEGYLKCKRAGAYVFTIFGPHDHEYSFEVNGITGLSYVIRQNSVTVNLKVGWNKVVLTAVKWCNNDSDVYKIIYLPQGSLSDPRPLTPAMLFHEQKPEEDW